jgi:predicted ATPase
MSTSADFDTTARTAWWPFAPFFTFAPLISQKMRLIQHIKASNLLSFGPDGLDLELHDLNVLIGPNGSGKSNFLEIFEVLRVLPRSEEDSNNLERVISRGGGREWVWKGEKTSRLSIVTTSSPFYIKAPLVHGFSLDVGLMSFVSDEFIKDTLSTRSQ